MLPRSRVYRQRRGTCLTEMLSCCGEGHHYFNIETEKRTYRIVHCTLLIITCGFLLVISQPDRLDDVTVECDSQFIHNFPNST
jgi:hypothetical protein